MCAWLYKIDTRFGNIHLASELRQKTKRLAQESNLRELKRKMAIIVMRSQCINFVRDRVRVINRFVSNSVYVESSFAIQQNDHHRTHTAHKINSYSKHIDCVCVFVCPCSWDMRIIFTCSNMCPFQLMMMRKISARTNGHFNSSN